MLVQAEKYEKAAWDDDSEWFLNLGWMFIISSMVSMCYFEAFFTIVMNGTRPMEQNFFNQCINSFGKEVQWWTQVQAEEEAPL